MGAFWNFPPEAGNSRPGYPLQFLKKPSAFLRDFRFYPLRGLACRARSARQAG
jgi:hypothetical protein